MIRRKALAESEEVEHIEELSLAQLHKLIFMLGAYSINEGRKFSQKIANLTNIAVARPLVIAAGTILDSWPRGFFNFLDHLRRTREIDIASPSLAKRFGFFYKYIYTQLTSPEFSFLHQTFERYVEKHWKGSLAERNTRLSADLRRRHAWLPLGVAAKRLGISKRRLLRLMDELHIEGSSMSTEAGRQMICISRTDITNIQSVLGELVDLTTACDMLGLKKKRMLQLLEAGAFTTAFKPKVSNNAKWGIRKDLIVALLSLCNALPDERECKKEKLLSLNSALRFQIRESYLLPELIAGIAKKEIFPVARDNRFRGITGMLFEHDALLAWIQQHRCGDREDAVSIPAAARRLGVKQEAMYYLVARGIFKIVLYSDRLHPLITANQLERFNEDFILSREIRKRTGVLPVHAYRRLAEFGILPVSGSRIDGGKLNVYRRDSVTDALLAIIGSPT